MKYIIDKMEKLKNSWAPLYQIIKEQPDSWQPYSSDSSIVEINEIISTLKDWASTFTAPIGFAPTFRLSMSEANRKLDKTLAYLIKLGNRDYIFFPDFLNSLNELSSAFHSMTIFSDQEQTRNAIGSLGGKLSESLSLLDTAQAELKNKVDLLNNTQKSIDHISTLESDASNYLMKIQEIDTEITPLRKSANEKLLFMNEIEQRISEYRSELDSIIQENKKMQENLNGQMNKVENIYNVNIEQQQLIEQLLPKGASVGLASAFAHRSNRLERTKWIWLAIFLGSIGLLASWSFFVLNSVINIQSQEIWKVILQRIPLAAPFIWLGWFSAIQYGNTIRVQEDYAFKEATSIAFTGYKDHMDHLANVNLIDGNTAMKLMAEKTIEILSREPLRIYQKNDADATPTKTLLNLLKIGGKNEE